MSPAALLLLSAFLHATWNAVTKTSRDKDSFVLLTIALSCALVALAWVLGREPFAIGGRAGLGYALLAGLFEAGYLVALAKGLARASLAKAYAIMRGGATALVWLSSLALRLEVFGPVTFAGSLLVVIGISITGLGAGPGRGELGWPLAAAVCIAGYHISYGESLRLGAEPKALFAVALTVSLPVLAYLNREGLRSKLFRTLSAEGERLVLSSAACALGFLVFLYGLRDTGPGYAITLRNTSIFFSIAFSFLIRDKTRRSEVAGAVVIGIGALALTLA